MANPEHVAKLKRVKIWNRWREESPHVSPDLSGADLSGFNLSGAALYGADLNHANLSGSDLSGALLYWAMLVGANLRKADLSQTHFHGANLTGADLSNADLSGADLDNATITDAVLNDLVFNDRTRWPAGFNPDSKPENATAAGQGQSLSGFKRGKDIEIPTAQDFSISFSSDLSPQQIRTALEALADYFRECGGAGFRFDFEFQTVATGESEHVGR